MLRFPSLLLLHGFNFRKETLLVTSLAAFKILHSPPNLDDATSHTLRKTLWLCIGAAVLYSAVHLKKHITHRFRSLSKWKLAFTFGAHLAGVKFVERYFDDPDDATNALQILQTMVGTDNHIRKLLIELGGLEITVKAMKRYGDDCEGVAVNGVGLIQAIVGIAMRQTKRF